MTKKILVAEDEPAVQRLIEFILQNQGYEVVKASNGLEALRKVKTDAPDLIVLDIMMPGIDGLEITRRLRADPQTANLPIVISSALARDVNIQDGLKAGANDYLTKPFERKVLIDKVRALLEKPPEAGVKHDASG